MQLHLALSLQYLQADVPSLALDQDGQEGVNLPPVNPYELIHLQYVRAAALYLLHLRQRLVDEVLQSHELQLAAYEVHERHLRQSDVTYLRYFCEAQTILQFGQALC